MVSPLIQRLPLFPGQGWNHGITSYSTAPSIPRSRMEPWYHLLFNGSLYSPVKDGTMVSPLIQRLPLFPGQGWNHGITSYSTAPSIPRSRMEPWYHLLFNSSLYSPVKDGTMVSPLIQRLPLFPGQGWNHGITSYSTAPFIPRSRMEPWYHLLFNGSLYSPVKDGTVVSPLIQRIPLFPGQGWNRGITSYSTAPSIPRSRMEPWYHLLFNGSLYSPVKDGTMVSPLIQRLPLFPGQGWNRGITSYSTAPSIPRSRMEPWYHLLFNGSLYSPVKGGAMVSPLIQQLPLFPGQGWNHGITSYSTAPSIPRSRMEPWYHLLFNGSLYSPVKDGTMVSPLIQRLPLFPGQGWNHGITSYSTVPSIPRSRMEPWYHLLFNGSLYSPVKDGTVVSPLIQRIPLFPGQGWNHGITSYSTTPSIPRSRMKPWDHLL